MNYLIYSHKFCSFKKAGVEVLTAVGCLLRMAAQQLLPALCSQELAGAALSTKHPICTSVISSVGFKHKGFFHSFIEVFFFSVLIHIFCGWIFNILMNEAEFF